MHDTCEKDANNKVLEKGDFFGEVSLIYDCKRSSTVKGKSPGTYGELDEDTIFEIFKDYPEFEKYLQERILRTYDDDLKVFLRQAFTQIDYMQNLDEEVLAHIGFCMEVKKMEAEEKVFFAGEQFEQMIIVLDGALELYTEMDKGNEEFLVEVLKSGSVINAHQFLIDRNKSLSCRCRQATTFYSMTAAKFYEIANHHPQLARVRNEQYTQAIEDMDNRTKVLDY